MVSLEELQDRINDLNEALNLAISTEASMTEKLIRKELTINMLAFKCIASGLSGSTEDDK